MNHDTIKKALDRGLTHEEIADLLDCSRARISQIAKELGYSRSFVTSNKLTDLEWVELNNYLKNHTITAAAKKFKISRTAIYNHLKNQ